MGLCGRVVKTCGNEQDEGDVTQSTVSDSDFNPTPKSSVVTFAFLSFKKVKLLRSRKYLVVLGTVSFSVLSADFNSLLTSVSARAPLSRSELQVAHSHLLKSIRIKSRWHLKVSFCHITFLLQYDTRWCSLNESGNLCLNFEKEKRKWSLSDNETVITTSMGF